MNIIFGEKTKIALLDLISNSSFDYIRLKVAAVGCGKPAYEIYPDYKTSEDILVEINDVKFVIEQKDQKLCNDTEIKYDKEVYNKGFYVRSL
ncbi:hypothetical protein JCM1393_01270 [Clostridium carnis]